MVETTIEKGLISLKEAASISGYSADYIGQLIRAGKISGKQVYCNVQWMTTAEAVMEYKTKGSAEQEKVSPIKSNLRKIGMELNILKLFFKTFKSALPIFVLLIVCFVFLLSFVTNNYFKYNQENINNNQTPEITF
jgi:hypothetical protein